MPFHTLWGDETNDSGASKGARNGTLELPPILPNGPKKKPVTTSKPRKQKARGCEVCPLDKVPGINKIFAHVTGKKILVVAQSPGPEENERLKELIGKSGKWFWAEMRRVGLSREDVDIFNTVRCFPADHSEGTYESYLKMRNPTAEEIHCCSVHTENELKQSQAKHILVLGQVAAKALLKTRSIPKEKIFWSDELQAKVYLLDHPAFFLRGYGNGPRLDAFRQTLDQLVNNLQQSGKTLADRFAYVRGRDYRLVLNREEALAAKAELNQYRGRRKIATDVEDAVFEDGNKIFACGFSAKAGQSFVFVFRHADQKAKDGAAVREIAVEILTDPEHRFALQYGCTDIDKWAEEGVTGINFVHDSQLSEYLRYSDKKAYGLEAIAEARFPEFSGYKYIVTADLIQGWAFDDPKVEKAYQRILTKGMYEQYKFIRRHQLFDLRKLSLDTLRIYNGADCDLTKRIENSNKTEVGDSLMRLYIDLSFLLHRMEPNGPIFDYKQCAALQKIYPYRERKLRRQLNRMLGRTKENPYNPGAVKQVEKALFRELGLDYPYADAKRVKDRKPNTRKRTLLMLGREHDFPNVQLEWRDVARVQSTNVSYKACADNNNGRLRTKWWPTGSRTGRLSSGGSKKKKDETEADIKVINLQNIKKRSEVQNVCVADLRWRQFYRAAKELAAEYAPDLLVYWKHQAEEDALAKKENRKPEKLKHTEASAKQELLLGKKLEAWVRENIPDLKTYLIHDYGQLEVRVMAQLCGDKNLKKDCMEADIHTTVGVTMTGWDPEKIRKDTQTRTLTKNVHFGIMFGLQDEALYEFVLAMSPVGQQGNITREEVFEGYKAYFKRYPGVKQFHNDMRAFGMKYKYVLTKFGMKQHLRISNTDEQDMEEFYEESANKERSSYWGNQAVNGPVQGTAHQMMICALVNLVRRVKKYAMLGIPPMEVHDALYFGVKVLDLVGAHALSKDLLENQSLVTAKEDFGIDWDVPIVTEAKAGLRLGCTVELTDGFTVAGFLVNWFRECRKQVIAMTAELRKVEASAAA